MSNNKENNMKVQRPRDNQKVSDAMKIKEKAKTNNEAVKSNTRKEYEEAKKE